MRNNAITAVIKLWTFIHLYFLYIHYLLQYLLEYSYLLEVCA